MHRYCNSAKVRSGEKLLRSNSKTLIKGVVKMNNAVPTDSVLRRHYEATHGQQSPTNKATKAAKAAKAAKECCGGFMSWLKRIFGS